MTKSPPLMLGYNNNVRYRGRSFHIQTEDSGTRYARIVTHLFVDGGRIVKSTKTQYDCVLDHPDLVETVRRMMKEQHRAMFLALRAGEYDAAIESIVGKLDDLTTPVPESVEPRSQLSDALASLIPARHRAPQAATPVVASVAPAVAPETPAIATVVAPVVEQPTERADRADEATLARLRRFKSSFPPRLSRLVDDPTPVELLPPAVATEQLRPSGRPQRVPQRPVTTTSAIPDPRAQSIFGGTGGETQTLDEVILSFLEEEDS